MRIQASAGVILTHAVSTKKARAVRATFWSAADITVRQGIHLACTVVLARLLLPEEFGLLALLSLFIGLGAVFVDGGLTSALIQRQDVHYNDECTMFWFNISASIGICALLWLLAPLIAAFYGNAVLELVTKVLALNLPLAAIGAVHHALLTKRLEFDKLVIVGASASLISGTAAVCLAISGFGVWSLVYQTLVSSAVASILVWVISPWRPSLIWSRHSHKRLLGFGGYMLASAVLSMIYAKAYTIVVGKFYGVSDLAYYSRAESTQQLPTNIMSGVLWRVFLSVFSESSHDKARLCRGVALAIRTAMLLNTPIMMGLAIVADPAVRILFGPQWLSSVPVLQVLCLAGLLWPLHFINVHALIAQGHSKLFFQIDVIKKAIGFLLMIVGSFFGIMGIAWSGVAFSLLAFFINTYYTGRFLGYSGWRQLADVCPILLISAVMGGIVYTVGDLLSDNMNSAVLLIVQIVSGIVSFVLLAVLFKLRSALEAQELLLSGKFGFSRGLI
jgi:teichuronic acid exporter